VLHPARPRWQRRSWRTTRQPHVLAICCARRRAARGSSNRAALVSSPPSHHACAGRHPLLYRSAAGHAIARSASASSRRARTTAACAAAASCAWTITAPGEPLPPAREAGGAPPSSGPRAPRLACCVGGVRAHARMPLRPGRKPNSPRCHVLGRGLAGPATAWDTATTAPSSSCSSTRPPPFGMRPSCSWRTRGMCSRRCPPTGSSGVGSCVPGVAWLCTCRAATPLGRGRLGAGGL
jgi:hypothetical protein